MTSVCHYMTENENFEHDRNCTAKGAPRRKPRPRRLSHKLEWALSVVLYSALMHQDIIYENDVIVVISNIFCYLRR